MRRGALLILTMYLAALAFAVQHAKAAAVYVPVPKHWHPPAGWRRGALCVHSRESGDWHIYNPPYANGFRFMLSTWIRAGGAASSWVSASPREQLYRAYVIWRADGGSWREWPNTSRACGLR